MVNNSSRIEREKRAVKLMVALYCRHHHSHNGLCNDCAHLVSYAKQRLDKCPFGNSKSVCEQCKIHCYQPDMRRKIKQVMRYCGPRMLIYHPSIAISHLVAKIAGKKSAQA